jgi:transcriptional regulator with XRE-family HTH domain
VAAGDIAASARQYRGAGCTTSTVSRIKSGQRVTSVTTLERLAATLKVELVIGFETEGGDRELVAV